MIDVDITPCARRYCARRQSVRRGCGERRGQEITGQEITLGSKIGSKFGYDVDTQSRLWLVVELARDAGLCADSGSLLHGRESPHATASE